VASHSAIDTLALIAVLVGSCVDRSAARQFQIDALTPGTNAAALSMSEAETEPAFFMSTAARVSSVLSQVTPGLTGTAEILVGPEHTAPFVGSGRIAVLATPVMINVIEAAALAAVEHLLPAGHQSLGIQLDVSHVAATPVGLRVTATAEVVRVEGRTITFRVEARDDFETIGGGSHQRVVVSVARFDERVQRKVRGEK